MAAATSGTATVTGKTGPNQSLTTATIRNVVRVTVDLANAMLFIYYLDGLTELRLELDYSTITTFTFTPSTGALTIS